jgi:hypothetical protein
MAGGDVWRVLQHKGATGSEERSTTENDDGRRWEFTIRRVRTVAALNLAVALRSAGADNRLRRVRGAL